MDNGKDMPVGLAFQLSMNENARETFSSMTDSEKRQVLDAARSATTKEQMRGIVSDLSGMN